MHAHIEQSPSKEGYIIHTQEYTPIDAKLYIVHCKIHVLHDCVKLFPSTFIRDQMYVPHFHKQIYRSTNLNY